MRDKGGIQSIRLVSIVYPKRTVKDDTSGTSIENHYFSLMAAQF